MGRLLKGIIQSELEKQNSKQNSVPAPVPDKKGNMSEQRVIDGGHAGITGAKEKGPQGHNLGLAKCLADSFPADVWIATDFTPKDQFGVDFGPMPEGLDPNTDRNPEFEGVPTFDGDPKTQPARLTGDWDGEGTVDFVHEYANEGCSGRIKAVGAHGVLSNLRYLYKGGSVPLKPSSIKIGLEGSTGPRTKGNRDGQ